MAANAKQSHPAPHFFEIDTAAVQAANADSAAQGEVPFVSTNDVITAAFFGACSADLGMMAINSRGRLKGLQELNAGNYENGNTACDCAPAKKLDSFIAVVPQRCTTSPRIGNHLLGFANLFREAR